MKLKRSDLQTQIDAEEAEKSKLQNEIGKLTEQLLRVNESLEKKIAVKNECGRVISEMEDAYKKVPIMNINLLSILNYKNSFKIEIFRSWKVHSYC